MRCRQRRLRTAGAVVVLLALGACGGDQANGGGQEGGDAPLVQPSTPTVGRGASDGEPASSPPTAQVSASSAGSASATGSATALPSPEQEASAAAASSDLAAVDVALQDVIDLDAPTALAVRPGDDALYVAERAGRVVAVRDGGVADEPLVDVSADTTVSGERGLLGLAFSPDGTQLYLSFTDSEGDTRVDQVAFSGDAVDPATRRTLITVEQPYANHNGGNVVVTDDGLLWLGLGDGGSGGDPQGNGQDPSTLLGALLRIDPTPSGDQPYTIPSDNPFVDDPQARPEVFAYGLRNPWRFSFDAATGDLWIGDVGQSAFEEINHVTLDAARGANFGWNRVEGTTPYEGGEPRDGDVLPVATYPHATGGCSVTGGYVYRGGAITALQGSYVYGDFCVGALQALVDDGSGTVASRDLGVGVESLVSFGEGPDGELYVLSLDGRVARLVAG